MELSTLEQMCVDTACHSPENVAAWRRQTRTLHHLPLHLAQLLFHRLLHSRLLTAPLLEVFQHTVQYVNVCGEPAVNAEWTAYFAGFRHLRAFDAADCRSISDSAVLHLKGLEHLERLNVSRCAKITDQGLDHIVSFSSLKELRISETAVTAKGLNRLSALKSLTSLDLGGLPVTDSVLSSLLALNQLQRLDLWGSNISDCGALYLNRFPHLEHLNLAWTGITQVPPLKRLKHLNMASCTVSSIFEAWEGVESPLEELILSGAQISNRMTVFAGSWTSNVLIVDLSSSNLTEIGVLSGMRKLESLDLSGTAPSDLPVSTISAIGCTLKHLDLSGAKIGSQEIEVLAGSVPRLEQISLSGTLVDDSVFRFLGLMPALQEIDLSHTSIKGFYYESGKSFRLSSLAALEQLHALTMLDLRNTCICDKACHGIGCIAQLTHLYLRSDLLSDISLQSLSLLMKLSILGIEGAMLTDSGLLDFRPPPLLKELHLCDCWLLTKRGILQFCEANRRMLVHHELLAGGSKMFLRPPKSESVKGSRTKGTAHFQIHKATKSSLFSRRPEYLDSLKSHSSQGTTRERRHRQMWGLQLKKREIPLVFVDERIKYTKAALLDLCHSLDSSQQLSGADLSKIPAGLLSAEPHVVGSL